MLGTDVRRLGRLSHAAVVQALKEVSVHLSPEGEVLLDTHLRGIDAPASQLDLTDHGNFSSAHENTCGQCNAIGDQGFTDESDTRYYCLKCWERYGWIAVQALKSVANSGVVSQHFEQNGGMLLPPPPPSPPLPPPPPPNQRSSHTMPPPAQFSPDPAAPSRAVAARQRCYGGSRGRDPVCCEGPGYIGMADKSTIEACIEECMVGSPARISLQVPELRIHVGPRPTLPPTPPQPSPTHTFPSSPPCSHILTHP